MGEILKGRAWVFGDDVDTDLIYHNKYLAETDPKNMPQYAFEYYPGKERTSSSRARTSAAARAASTPSTASNTRASRASSPRRAAASTTGTR